MITHAGDTTVRVAFRTGGYEHVITTATVEWWGSRSNAQSKRSKRARLASAEVPCLRSGNHVAFDPFFHEEAGRLFCIATIMNNKLLHGAEERMRIEIGTAGNVSCDMLDDTALHAAQMFMRPQRPFTHVHANCDDVELAESSSFDESVTINVLAQECCGGNKMFAEMYRIDGDTGRARIVARTLFMNALERPRRLLKVARQITTTASMRLMLHTDNGTLRAHDPDDDIRMWRQGLALVPNTTAWIVATKHTRSVMWAFVVCRPVLTPDVRHLFRGSNSSEPGRVAGWVHME